MFADVFDAGPHPFVRAAESVRRVLREQEDAVAVQDVEHLPRQVVAERADVVVVVEVGEDVHLELLDPVQLAFLGHVVRDADQHLSAYVGAERQEPFLEDVPADAGDHFLDVGVDQLLRRHRVGMLPGQLVRDHGGEDVVIGLPDDLLAGAADHAAEFPVAHGVAELVAGVLHEEGHGQRVDDLFEQALGVRQVLLFADAVEDGGERVHHHEARFEVVGRERHAAHELDEHRADILSLVEDLERKLAGRIAGAFLADRRQLGHMGDVRDRAGVFFKQDRPHECDHFRALFRRELRDPVRHVRTDEIHDLAHIPVHPDHAAAVELAEDDLGDDRQHLLYVGFLLRLPQDLRVRSLVFVEERFGGDVLDRAEDQATSGRKDVQVLHDMHELRKPLFVQQEQPERLRVFGVQHRFFGKAAPLFGDRSGKEIGGGLAAHADLVDPERLREVAVRTQEPEIVVDIAHVQSKRDIVRDGLQKIPVGGLVPVVGVGGLRGLDREEEDARLRAVGQHGGLRDGFVPRAGGFGADVERKLETGHGNAAFSVGGFHGVRRDHVVQRKSGKLAGTSPERLFRGRIRVQDHAVAPADDHTVRQVAVYCVKSLGGEADLSVLRSFFRHVRASFLSKD